MEEFEGGSEGCRDQFTQNRKNPGIRCKRVFENRLRVSMSKINLNPKDFKKWHTLFLIYFSDLKREKNAQVEALDFKHVVNQSNIHFIFEPTFISLRHWT